MSRYRLIIEVKEVETRHNVTQILRCDHIDHVLESIDARPNAVNVKLIANVTGKWAYNGSAANARMAILDWFHRGAFNASLNPEPLDIDRATVDRGDRCKCPDGGY